jgi:glycosyltransferase involved in cell wall biosynthesis/acetyltransferase-like isoleucine patch superfamily enzyme
VATADLLDRATAPAAAGRPRERGPFDRPVRVCFLIDELTTAGTETQLLALIRHLDRRRVEPFLCLLRGEGVSSRSLEPDDCPVLRLGVRSFRRPAALRAAWRLARFLRRRRIDVLQAYFPESTYFGVPVGWLAGVPRILRTRNNLGYWMTPWHRRLGRLCDRLADGLVANCGACRDAVVADEGLAPERVVVLENGVDLARFPSPTLPLTRRVGVTANLRPVKGLEVFVRAAAAVGASHPDISFAVAGEGPQRRDLERLAGELGLGGRLTLAGSVADVPAFLGRLGVAVLPSLSEGMSNALLEYMAAGRPVVATAVGGSVHLIEDGVHGLLVPPGDPGALAGAVRRLLDDPALAARLGAAARRRVEERYSRPAMVRRFEDFYQGLCFDPSRARSESSSGVSGGGRGSPASWKLAATETGGIDMRAYVRGALVLAAAVLTAPLWVPCRLQGRLTGGEGVFAGCSELLSLVPGLPGVYLRRGFYRLCLEACATDCHIGFGTTVAHPQVRIGRGVYVGSRCTLGKVVIEDHVAIGSNVDVLSGRHQHHFARRGVPIQQQGGTFRRVRIGRNSWVGNSAVVMADVGDECVVGAGSVVVKPVPAGCIAAGNPAVVKRHKGDGARSPVTQVV